jgi:hypothetical protein
MQNRSNFPVNKTLNQSPVKTQNANPVQNSNNLADGKTPHQPTESKES